MSKVDKQQRELEQLRVVYSDEEFPVAINADKPDFRLLQDEQWFGVEVTTFTLNKASGRLLKEKSHLSHLIATGVVPSKERNDLQIVNLVMSGPDDSSVLGSNMVLRKIPPLETRINILGAVIESKIKKALEYNLHGLTHCDLVIIDERGDLTSGVTHKQSIDTLRRLQACHPPIHPYRRITLAVKQRGVRQGWFRFVFEKHVIEAKKVQL